MSISSPSSGGLIRAFNSESGDRREAAHVRVDPGARETGDTRPVRVPGYAKAARDAYDDERTDRCTEEPA